MAWDIGAHEFDGISAASLPVTTISSVTVDGQSVTVAGSATNTPTSVSVTLVGSGGGVTQGPTNATLTGSNFSITFSALPAGTYLPQATATNALASGSTVTGSSVSILGISGNPQDGEAPPIITTTPSASVASTSISGRTLSANGFVDLKGDATGRLAISLVSGGQTISITEPGTGSGTQTLNRADGFWGFQVDLTPGNAYTMTMTPTANSQSPNISGPTLAIALASGAGVLPAS